MSGPRHTSLAVLGLLALPLWLPGLLLALDPKKSISQYPLDTWRTEEGLPQSVVFSICQTPEGYLWLGTGNGLARFDGVRFRAFTKRADPGFKGKDIWRLFADPAGPLWFSSLGTGLGRYQGTSFEFFTPEAGLSDTTVNAIARDENGDLVTATDGGLDRFDGVRFHPLLDRMALPSTFVLALATTHGGPLWIGTSKGLCYLENGHLRTYTSRDGLPNVNVRALLLTRDRSLWIGGVDGSVTRFRDGAFSLVFKDPEQAPVSSLVEDRDGNLWAGTYGGGVFRVQGDTWTSLREKQGLASDTVNAMFEDREGSLWIGTLKGLNRLRDSRFTVVSTSEGLAEESVVSIAEDPRGALWFGTLNRGITRIENGQATSYSTANGLPNNRAVSVSVMPDGSVWVATLGGGLARYDGHGFSTVSKADGLPSNYLRSVTPARGGGVWAGASAGLALIKDGSVTSYASLPGAPIDINALLEDRTGTLWIGTITKGLTRFHNGRFTRFARDHPLSRTEILGLYHDGNALFAGTADAGFFRVTQDAITHFDTRSGLPDEIVAQILEDRSGNIWIGTAAGIHRARKEHLEAFAAGKVRSVEWTSFGTGDGMQTAECSGGTQPGAIVLRDGRLVFPTLRGAVFVDPERLPKNPLPPPVHIEEITANGVPLSAGSPLVAPAGSQRLEFHYTALSFAVPGRVRFRYWLEGFDEKWVDAGPQRLAHYSNLTPGRYVFHVNACNNDGVWNEKGDFREFILRPRFYQTGWFRLASGATLLVSFLAAHRLRLRSLARRQKVLEAAIQEKTQELREAYEGLRKADVEIARLTSASSLILEDPEAWTEKAVPEISSLLGVKRIGIFTTASGRTSALSPCGLEEPNWQDIKPGCFLIRQGNRTVVPILGMTSESRGALVIEGSIEGEAREKLVGGFARQLGTALELRQLRDQLSAAESRQAMRLQDMHARGIATLTVCPECDKCFDNSFSKCPADGQPLTVPLLLPYRIGGRYRLDSRLGEGGMGTVFAALDERLNRKAALKIVKPEYLNDSEMRFRLEREARAIAHIKHPGVVTLLDVGELEDGSEFLVMELLEGLELAEVLKRFGPGSARQVASVLAQAGAGLAAAHRAGVIHRDIKPENIFLSTGSWGIEARILDFGLAKQEKIDTKLTHTGIILGTPLYMAPEQLLGEPSTERSDLYSLAATMWEALTGKMLASGNGLTEIMTNALFSEPLPLSAFLPHCPRELDAAFSAALAKKALARPSSIEGWVQETTALLEAIPCEGGWPVPLPSGKKPRTREMAVTEKIDGAGG